jgi:tripartite-type tricarboxylate transporter receptor subunit TctC
MSLSYGGGILGPPGMPIEIVNLLNSQINKLLHSTEIKAAFLRERCRASPGSPAQYLKPHSSGYPAMEKYRKTSKYNC